MVQESRRGHLAVVIATGGTAAVDYGPGLNREAVQDEATRNTSRLGAKRALPQLRALRG